MLLDRGLEAYARGLAVIEWVFHQFEIHGDTVREGLCSTTKPRHSGVGFKSAAEYERIPANGLITA